MIDHTTAGTVFDGIVDGFPNLAAKDGTGDFGGNPLSRRPQGRRHRGPLGDGAARSHSSRAIAAERIQSATLRFNVDDVLSTLGPGTELNGQAADTILVHLYDGDGAATPGRLQADRRGAGLGRHGAGRHHRRDARQDGCALFRRRRARTPAGGRRRRARRSSASCGAPPTRRPAPRSTTAAAARRRASRRTRRPARACRSSRHHRRSARARLRQRRPRRRRGLRRRQPDRRRLLQRRLRARARRHRVRRRRRVHERRRLRAGVCAGALPCGNGALDAGCGEECDDGNAAAADGCSRTAGATRWSAAEAVASVSRRSRS